MEHPLKDNTSFIWYEDTQQKNAKKTFRDINSGKTPLTNAELIKALFINNLKNENKEIQNLKQNELAAEWDMIEQALNNDAFWYFISNETDKIKYPTRIDFLFELIVRKSEKHKDNLYTYRQYAIKNEKLDWDKIKMLFFQLREWFDNRELYHLIGFIIYSKLDNIKTIIEDSKGCDKLEFKQKLKDKIINKFGSKDKEGNDAYDFDNLSYDSKSETLNILLLHNIETYQKSEAAFRFPFDHFKKEKWSLEHIHAQNAEKFNTGNKVNAWLEDLEGLLEQWRNDSDIKEEIENLKNNLSASVELTDEQKKQRNDLMERTDEKFQTHSLSNLALLNKNTNSKLGNINFKDKRAEILKIDKQNWIQQNGDESKPFIPICTKNVFLKYYTKNITQMEYWGFRDRKDYIENIRETLSPYFKQKKK